MKKFTYKVLDVPSKGFWGGSINYQELTDKLNDLGQQGWEVVSMGATNMYSHATKALLVILKKEIN